eukprot:m.30792 g.30792  ORF g.30792 m.30792 type:complete len:944 (+) comp9555_c0_seq1:108-2939(+)
MTDTVDEVAAFKRHFLDFIESEEHGGDYTQKIHKMVDKGQQRVVFDLDHFRAYTAEPLAHRLLREPLDHVQALQLAVKETVDTVNSEYSKAMNGSFFAGFEGSFGANQVTPRGLSARLLGQMVCLEGIVSKCSLIHPKVVKSVHYCPETEQSTERTYRDATSIDGMPTVGVYPKEDDAGNKLVTEFGLSIYKNHQTLTVQEMPERAPTGQLPRSVDIILDDDLVDATKPGDRVQIVGIYRSLASKKQGSTSGVFKTVVIANNVRILDKEALMPEITAADIAQFKKLAKQFEEKDQSLEQAHTRRREKKDKKKKRKKKQGGDDGGDDDDLDDVGFDGDYYSHEGYDGMFKMLARSLAPSIYGNEEIKQGMLCLLLGGQERNLDHGGHIRGDINVLLVGDPSCGKSQMLRFVQNTAPHCITTTGRGSSGVGLTAAVTTDRDTGERRLEAGAMVLGDRGIVCIDEFDKMSDLDRVSIHEVMEQQTVTIAKAGIHTSLNARCSVLAAANPVYGQYNPFQTPMDNIGLPDSLLSRFDLLFILLDKMDPKEDQKLAGHVLRSHMWRKPGEVDNQVLHVDTSADTSATAQDDHDPNKETPVFAAHTIHNRSRAATLHMDFVKKYLYYAKSLPEQTPTTLTMSAAEYIKQSYWNLRDKQSKVKTLPVTPRTLESIIRLATAHARSRLSNKVEEKDAHAAMSLMEFAYFNEDKYQKRPSKRSRRADTAGDDSDDDDSDGGDDGETGRKQQQQQRTPSSSKKTPKRKRDGSSQDSSKDKSSPPSSGSAFRRTEPRQEQSYDPYDFQTTTPDGRQKRVAVTKPSSEAAAAEPSATRARKKLRVQPTDKSSAAAAAAAKAKPQDDFEQEEEDEPMAPEPVVDKALLEPKFPAFRKLLADVFRTSRQQDLPVNQVRNKIVDAGAGIAADEVRPLLLMLQDKNDIMLADDTVFLLAS